MKFKIYTKGLLQASGYCYLANGAINPAQACLIR